MDDYHLGCLSVVLRLALQVRARVEQLQTLGHVYDPEMASNCSLCDCWYVCTLNTKQQMLFFFVFVLGFGVWGFGGVFGDEADGCRVRGAVGVVIIYFYLLRHLQQL